jgi:hypothetical protein
MDCMTGCGYRFSACIVTTHEARIHNISGQNSGEAALHWESPSTGRLADHCRKIHAVA